VQHIPDRMKGGGAFRDLTDLDERFAAEASRKKASRHPERRHST